MSTPADWSVGPSGDRFTRDGRDVFLLADTLWSAFIGPTDDEWDAYLIQRRRQGFDAVFVSVLPIPHDRSDSDEVPFQLVNGAWDVGQINPGYLDRVRKRVARATDMGMLIIPVLLWNGYMPGTWGTRVSPGLVMTAEQRSSVVSSALEVLLPHCGIILVSGDDNLDSDEAIEGYVEVAHLIHATSQPTLVGLHTGPLARYTPWLADQGWDFYGFQSGHGIEEPVMVRELASHHRAHPARRPVLNLEPPYEDHARVNGEGRHSARDVRAASWTSVLVGATAGLGYGAQGVWGWHREGSHFSGVAFSGMPKPFSEALHFRGADDVAFLKELVERHALFPVALANKFELAAPGGSIVGADSTGSMIAAYVSGPGPLTIAVDLRDFEVVSYDLELRREVRPQIASSSAASTIEADGAQDVLHVMNRHDGARA